MFTNHFEIISKYNTLNITLHTQHFDVITKSINNKKNKLRCKGESLVNHAMNENSQGEDIIY